MRKLVSLFVVLSLALTLLTGCGAGGLGAQKTVVIGLASDWQTMDPAQAYEVFGNLYFYATYDNLYKLEGSDLSSPKPCLAKDYKLDDSGKVYTFTLKDGLKFASGNKITSKDVAFSINRVKNLKSNTSHHAEGIDKIETPDDNTVIITLKERDASFMSKISNNSFCVVDSEVVKNNGGTDAPDASTTDKATEYLNSHSAGSGPFILKSWTINTEMVLEKNPNYWGKQVDVDQIIIKEIPDPNAQVQMLEKGEIDIAFSVGPDQIKTLEGKDDIRILNAATSTCSFLLMNSDITIGGPVANSDVQQAIRYAIDYSGFKTLAGDGALLPRSFVPDGFVGAKSRPDGYQNLEKAKDLLAKAGYKDGFDITLTAANYDSEGMQWPTIAQKAKDDLSKIGINVKIETKEVGVVIEDYRNGKVPFLVMHWAPDYYDLNNQLVYIPGDVIGMRANWPADANPELVTMAKEVAQEMDAAKRAELSGKMQDIIAENSPYAFILQHPKTFASTKKIDGVVYNDLCKLQLAELKIVQ